VSVPSDLVKFPGVLTPDGSAIAVPTDGVVFLRDL